VNPLRKLRKIPIAFRALEGDLVSELWRRPFDVRNIFAWELTNLCVVWRLEVH
jgi:hypothetical protein